MNDSLVSHKDMEPLLKDRRLFLELSEELKDSTDIVLSAYLSHRTPEGYEWHKEKCSRESIILPGEI